jgi:TonB family protein
MTSTVTAVARSITTEVHFMKRAILTVLTGCCLSGYASDRNVLRVVSAEYPPVAVAARIQGEVTVQCVIDAEGRVASARVGEYRGLPSQPLRLLEKAALANVR